MQYIANIREIRDINSTSEVTRNHIISSQTKTKIAKHYCITVRNCINNNNNNNNNNNDNNNNKYIYIALYTGKAIPKALHR